MSTKIVAARLATSAGVTTVITRSSNPGNVAKILDFDQRSKLPGSTISSTTVAGHDATTSSGVRHTANGAAASPPLHTRFLPDRHPIRNRHFWLLHGLAAHGTLYIDAGAHRALAKKAGLLPVGIIAVHGSFAQQEAVRLVVVERSSTGGPTTLQPSKSAMATTTATATAIEPPTTGLEVGRALVNYNATEISRIMGLRSSEIQSVLGYADSEYIALRENVSLFEKSSGGASSVE